MNFHDLTTPALAVDADAGFCGVMGYGGHVVGNPDRDARADAVDGSMALLSTVRDAAGDGLTSAGGTGTFDLHPDTDEVQAGSYLLMDTHYDQRYVFEGEDVPDVSTVDVRGW